MNSYLMPLHLIFIGVWLGCVLTEALFERALLGQGRSEERILARLHIRVDLFIEIPAFVMVLVTGVLMLAQTPPSTALLIKVVCGLVAIATNVICVALVFKRHAFAQAGKWAEFEGIDHLQHKLGAVVLVALLAALGVGLTLV